MPLREIRDATQSGHDRRAMAFATWLQRQRWNDLTTFPLFSKDETDDVSIDGRWRVLAKLERAAKRMFRQARECPVPWNYCPIRHRHLLATIKRERGMIDVLSETEVAA